MESTSMILVTGANGFLGTWIVKKMLEKGYTVRAAVRTLERGSYLREKFKHEGERLEIVAVGDLTKPNAFDEAVKDVDAIIHTASPVTITADNPEDLIEPAVKGVTGILESARDHGTRVRRIVITSSCAAILDTANKAVTVSEDNWNDRRVRECEMLGRHASGLSKYSASKTLAERAAWEFVQVNRDRVLWDLTTIAPPYIFGPTIHEITSPRTLNSSSWLFYRALVHNDFGGVLPHEGPGHGWVDVRDAADAHIRAVEVPSAGGQRIIVSSGSWVWQDFINTALDFSESIYRPHPAVTWFEVKERFITFQTDKQERILGLKLRPMKDTVSDVLIDYAKRGW